MTIATHYALLIAWVAMAFGFFLGCWWAGPRARGEYYREFLAAQDALRLEQINRERSALGLSPLVLGETDSDGRPILH